MRISLTITMLFFYHFSVLLKVKKMSLSALMTVFVNGIIRRSQGVFFYYFLLASPQRQGHHNSVNQLP